MFKKNFVFFIFIWLGCYAKITPNYNNSDKYLIYGGYIPLYDIYTKFVVSIAESDGFNLNDPAQFGNGHICGGTIISLRTILTAAHCLIGYKPSNLVVIAGSPVRIRKTKTTQIMYVRDLIMHPLYQGKPVILYDIGVILLMKKLISYRGKVAVLKHLSFSPVEPGITCTHIGWGLVGEKGDSAETIRYIDMLIQPKEVCDENYKPVPKTFCAVAVKKRPGGSCSGDSGGPIFCDNVLSGVVTTGTDCSTTDPTYFTDVSRYVDWVKDNTMSDLAYRSSSRRKLDDNIHFKTLSIMILVMYGY